MNVVDAALVEADGVTTPKNTVTALVVLATEVRRLRAGVEAVRALPSRVVPHNQLGGVRYYLHRDDVLAALGVTDAD